VARNVVTVPARELAVAPVSNMASAEPVRSSVLGAGKPVARPPAAVSSRAVVALRTPASMPGSFAQRQAQAGGHLNQSSSLVRQEAPGRPVPTAPPTRQPQADDAFRSFGQSTSGTSQAKTQPRVWEAQGTPEPESSAQTQPENRGAQSSRQWSHPLAKPVTPVRQGNTQQQRDQEQKFSTWQQQRPAPAPARQQNSHPSVETHASSPKK